MKEGTNRTAWINEEQLHETKYAGKRAQELIDSGTLETKPHTNQFLANKGDKLYAWDLTWSDDTTKTGDRTAVKCEGAVEAEYYENVRDKMAASEPADFRSPKTSGKIPKPPKQRSPSEEQKLQDSRRASQALARASSLVQKITKTVRDEAMNDLDGKLGSKSWAKEIRVVLKSEAKAVQDSVNVLHHLWSAESLNAKANGSVNIKALEDNVALLGDTFKEFEGGCLADAKRIIGS